MLEYKLDVSFAVERVEQVGVQMSFLSRLRRKGLMAEVVEQKLYLMM